MGVAILKCVATAAIVAIKLSVNSTCGLIVYEPQMPIEAEKYIK